MGFNLGNLIGGAVHAVTNLLPHQQAPQPQAQPFNYQRPTITPSQLQVAGNIGRSINIPQITPSQLQVAPVARQPQINVPAPVANINQATNFLPHAPSVATPASNNPFLRVAGGLLHGADVGLHDIRQIANPGFDDAMQRQQDALKRGDVKSALSKENTQGIYGGFLGYGGMKNVAANAAKPLVSAAARGAEDVAGNSGIQKIFSRTISQLGRVAPTAQKMFTDMENTHLGLTGNDLKSAQTAMHLHPNDFGKAVDVMQGRLSPDEVHPLINKAAGEIKNVMGLVLSRRNKFGIEGGDLGSTYFPKNYHPDTFKPGTDLYNQAIRELMDQGKTAAKATQMLGSKVEEGLSQSQAAQILRQNAPDVVRNRKQGNLELSRNLDLSNFEKTPEAFAQYLYDANRRISEVAHFGANDKNMLSAIEKDIAQNGGNFSEAKKLFDTAVGANKYGRTSQRANTMLRALMAGSKLGFAGIGNATQSVNTVTKYGGSGLKAVLQGLTGKLDKPTIQGSGAAIDPLLNDLRSQSGGLGQKTSKILMPFFNKIEGFNRNVAAQAGINAAKKAGVTDQAALEQAARDASKSTQFIVNPAHLPPWASTPWGRTIAQFRNFAYNQGDFVKNEVVDPAMHGNIAPALRYIPLAAGAGYGAYELKNLAQQGIQNFAINPAMQAMGFTPPKPQKQDPLFTALGAEGGAGGLGLGPDTILRRAASLGHDAPTTALNITGDIAGPAYGQIAKSIYHSSQAIHGQPKNIEKDALKMIPFAGNAISSSIFPYQGNNGGGSGGSGKGGSLDNQFNHSNLGLLIQGNTISYRKSDGSTDHQNIDDLTRVRDNPIAEGARQEKLNTYMRQVYSQYLDRNNNGVGGISEKDMKSIFNKLGVQPNDIEYAVAAGLKTPEQAKYMVDALRQDASKLQPMLKNKVITSATISEAYNDGLISEEEYNGLKDALKASTAVGQLSLSRAAAKKSASSSRAATAKLARLKAPALTKLKLYSTSQAPATPKRKIAAYKSPVTRNLRTSNRSVNTPSRIKVTA